jgi:predicted secreted protein
MAQKLAQGATITWGGSPVIDVSNLDFGADTQQVDVTSHDSADSTREFIAGLREPQEVPMTVFYDPSEHVTLADAQGDSSLTATLDVNDADGEPIGNVQAWVKSVIVHLPSDGSAQTADIVFQTTGPVDWGASS